MFYIIDKIFGYFDFDKMKLFARHKGKQIGRPEGKQEDEVLLKKYSRLAADLSKGLSLSQCQKLHDVSRNTAIKVKRLTCT